MNAFNRRRCLLVVLAVGLLVTVGAPSAVAGRPAPWVWPLQPRPAVVRAFEAPLGPYGPGHRGADLAGSVGQPVLAVDDGRVSFAGTVAGRGVVVIDHGRLRTTYEPVLVAVSEGDRVAAAQVLGTLTLAGGHCLPAACLHLGARAGDVYVDPLQYLGTGRVRLLPLDGQPATAGAWPPTVGPPGLGSGAGVGLLVGGPQPIGGDVGVDLRRRERLVAEQFLYRAQVRPAFEQVRGGTVP
ncbi:hypothetical protein BH20ACT6_BH20ACT6_21300 [soil metagenome]